MAWFLLLVAGACEMVWPLGFKRTDGFTKDYWIVGVTFAVMGVSLWLMAQATARGIPIGTAYAVWTGMGAAGTAVLGMVLFHEPRDWMRITCLTLIVVGVVGLKLLSPPMVGKTPVAESTTTGTGPTSESRAPGDDDHHAMTGET